MAEQKHPERQIRPKAARTLRCEEWEALLVDALDGMLPATESAAFEAHSEECKACAELLAHTKQGREWLGYLHREPEVPGDLLAKILTRTTGAEGIPLAVAAGPQPAIPYTRSIPFRRSFYETRLLMTAAMAFFSIALTLNLAGVKLSNLRLADLKPSAISGTLSRQFYGTKEQVVKYYDNLRFVYQMESKVRELRRDVEEQPAAAPSNQNKDNGGKDNGKPGHSRNGSGGQLPNARHDAPAPVVSRGGFQLASFRLRGMRRRVVPRASGEQAKIVEVVGPRIVFIDDQAESLSGRRRPFAGDHERSLA